MSTIKAQEHISWLEKPQPHLGLRDLVALMLIASLMTLFSLDMYTPSIPHMADYSSTDEATANLTLWGYYLFFAVGMLVLGLISDWFGRHPVLLAGLVFYIVGGVSHQQFVYIPYDIIVK